MLETQLNKRDVEARINERLRGLLVPEQFRYRRHHEAFVREIEGGSQTVAVALVDYAPVFEFAPVFTVRLEAVETIFNRFNGAPPHYHHLTQTSISPPEFVVGVEGFEASTREQLEGSNNLANLAVVTPRFHLEIRSPLFHFGRGG